MAVYTLKSSDFVKGESYSEFVPSGAFSPLSNNLNLTKEPGVVYFRENETDRGGATLTGNILASTFDKNLNGNDAYFLDDDGAFYTIKGATFTKRQTITADTFQLGTSEMLQHRGVTYATGLTTVQALTGSDLSGITDSFFSGLTTGYRHPLEKVDDTLYVGDVNVIHTITDASTTSASVITLPTDVNITSLRKHPDGENLIAFCGLTADLSHTRNTPGRAYIIDPVIKDWIREINLQSQVEGTRLVSETVYTVSGREVGYFNGDGVTPLGKKLRNNSNVTTTYSHNLGNIDDILLVRDGRNILAFGDLGAGRVWWNFFRNNAGTEEINNFIYKGDNNLLVAYADSTAGDLVEVDYDNIGVGGLTTNGNAGLYTNHIDFGGEVQISRIDVIHDESNSSGTTSFIAYYVDHNQDATEIETKSYTNVTASRTRLSVDIKTDIFQLRILPASADIGIHSLRIYYEPI